MLGLLDLTLRNQIESPDVLETTFTFLDGEEITSRGPTEIGYFIRWVDTNALDLESLEGVMSHLVDFYSVSLGIMDLDL